MRLSTWKESKSRNKFRFLWLDNALTVEQVLSWSARAQRFEHLVKSIYEKTKNKFNAYIRVTPTDLIMLVRRCLTSVFSPKHVLVVRWYVADIYGWVSGNVRQSRESMVSFTIFLWNTHTPTRMSFRKRVIVCLRVHFFPLTRYFLLFSIRCRYASSHENDKHKTTSANSEMLTHGRLTGATLYLCEGGSGNDSWSNVLAQSADVIFYDWEVFIMCRRCITSSDERERQTHDFKCFHVRHAQVCQ